MPGMALQVTKIQQIFGKTLHAGGAIGEKMGFALVHVRAWLGKEWGEPG